MNLSYTISGCPLRDLNGVYVWNDNAGCYLHASAAFRLEQSARLTWIIKDSSSERQQRLWAMGINFSRSDKSFLSWDIRPQDGDWTAAPEMQLLENPTSQNNKLAHGSSTTRATPRKVKIDDDSQNIAGLSRLKPSAQESSKSEVTLQLEKQRQESEPKSDDSKSSSLIQSDYRKISRLTERGEVLDRAEEEEEEEEKVVDEEEEEEEEDIISKNLSLSAELERVIIDNHDDLDRSDMMPSSTSSGHWKRISPPPSAASSSLPRSARADSIDLPVSTSKRSTESIPNHYPRVDSFRVDEGKRDPEGSSMYLSPKPSMHTPVLTQSRVVEPKYVAAQLPPQRVPPVVPKLSDKVEYSRPLTDEPRCRSSSSTSGEDEQYRATHSTVQSAHATYRSNAQQPQGVPKSGVAWKPPSAASTNSAESQVRSPSDSYVNNESSPEAQRSATARNGNHSLYLTAESATDRLDTAQLTPSSFSSGVTSARSTTPRTPPSAATASSPHHSSPHSADQSTRTASAASAPSTVYPALARPSTAASTATSASNSGGASEYSNSNSTKPMPSAAAATTTRSSASEYSNSYSTKPMPSAAAAAATTRSSASEYSNSYSTKPMPSAAAATATTRSASEYSNSYSTKSRPSAAAATTRNSASEYSNSYSTKPMPSAAAATATTSSASEYSNSYSTKPMPSAAAATATTRSASEYSNPYSTKPMPNVSGGSSGNGPTVANSSTFSHTSTPSAHTVTPTVPNSASKSAPRSSTPARSAYQPTPPKPPRVVPDPPRYTRPVPTLAPTSLNSDWEPIAVRIGFLGVSTKYYNSYTGDLHERLPDCRPNVGTFTMDAGEQKLSVFAPIRAIQELGLGKGSSLTVAYVSEEKEFEKYWSSSVAAYEHKIAVLEHQLKYGDNRVSSTSERELSDLQRKYEETESELKSLREKEEITRKRADALISRGGKSHIKRDWEQSNVSLAFPTGDQIRSEFHAAFMNFESFAFDVINCLEDLNQDEPIRALVHQVMNFIFSDTQTFVEDNIKAKKALLKAEFGVVLPREDVASEESISRLFWYQTQQAQIPKIIASLTDEEVLALMANMDALVIDLHSAMLRAAQEQRISDGARDLRLPLIVRSFLRLHAICLLSDPPCYLSPAPGQTIQYREGLCTEILSPGTRKYGRIKDGDVVEVVMCGLYFEHPRTNPNPVVPCLVRRVVNSK